MSVCAALAVGRGQAKSEVDVLRREGRPGVKDKRNAKGHEEKERKEGAGDVVVDWEPVL